MSASRLALSIAALAVIVTAGARSGTGWSDALIASEAGLGGGELWRLFTGPLAHATWGHLVRDLALLVFLAAGFRPARSAWLFAAGLAVPSAAVFALEPGLSVYYGTSGLTHALLAAVIAAELTESANPRWLRLLAAAAGAALAIKLGFELATGAPAFPMDLGPGIRQLPSAHAAGAAVGLAVALAPGSSARRASSISC